MTIPMPELVKVGNQPRLLANGGPFCGRGWRE